MRLVWHVACIRQIRTVHKILFINQEEKRLWKHLMVDNIKMICKKSGGRIQFYTVLKMVCHMDFINYMY